MVKNSTLDVLAWIRRLSPDFKDSITPYGLSCVFPYNQIRVDEPLLPAIANYWVPTWHIFHFNGIELCPTIMGEDLPFLLQVALDVPSATANRWCVFSKLNLRLVFEYFSSSGFLMGERPHSYFLHAFYLCALARYFLVQNSLCGPLDVHGGL